MYPEGTQRQQFLEFLFTGVWHQAGNLLFPVKLIIRIGMKHDLTATFVIKDLVLNIMILLIPDFVLHLGMESPDFWGFALLYWEGLSSHYLL